MIVAVTMVRDEQDILGYTLMHLLSEGIDRIIVADNLSTDHTPNIIQGLLEDGAPITLIEDTDPGYYQARKMTRLARLAAAEGADWVLPFDADELWYSPTGTIAESLAACDADIVRASGWDHIATLADIPLRNPFKRITYRRREPQKLPKVAFRADPHASVHMGNHDVDRPGEAADDVLLYRHFQYRSLAQMTRKVRQGRQAYEASTLHYNYGTHWRTLGALSDDDLAAHWHDLCNEDHLVEDPAPYRARL